MRAHLTIEGGEGTPSTCELHPERPVTLGRNRNNTIVLQDEHASRWHAEIFFEDGRWLIRDFDTRNGTLLNDQRIHRKAVLENGQSIGIGETRLRFVLEMSKEDATAALAKCSFADQPSVEAVSLGATVLKTDELNALCSFMAASVAETNPEALVQRALQTIHTQTLATATGFLSLDEDDPLPKMVLPDLTHVDLHLSRSLTQRVQSEGRAVWLAAQGGPVTPNESLMNFTDALCIPLRSEGAPLGAIHVYRSSKSFTERDLRFGEILAAHLANCLRLLRARRTLEAENSRLRSHSSVTDQLIGDSAAMKQLRLLITRAAARAATVLIVGESGVGKELVALGVHRQSPRRDGPLVVVNGAAIATSLLEAELFGYRKGAFTGAERDHPGLFQQADDGSLFLDEVGELPVECQAKLLRVLEGKGFRPVGATAEVRANVRIIAATHRDLDKEVRAGRFREDLYFRLRVIPIAVPPLREHAEDIPALVQYFLNNMGIERHRRVRLTEVALRRLQEFSWPGNVRQLRSVLECAVAMSDRDLLDVDDLMLPAEAPPGSAPSLNLEELETWAIRQALRRTGGNITQAAKLLGVVRDTLTSKIKRKGIDRNDMGEPD